MKKVLLFFGWILLFASTANAQVPQGIPYQAVARNGQGQPLASANVKVRFSILDSTATGTAVYVESHTTTTSALGLFTANVGMGTASTGTFSSINWGQNFKFLKVELDTTATGNSYIDLGTQQMMSVPYALYAGSTASSSQGSQISSIENDSVLTLTGGKIFTSGNYTVPQSQHWKLVSLQTVNGFGSQTQTMGFAYCNPFPPSSANFYCYYGSNPIPIITIKNDVYFGSILSGGGRSFQTTYPCQCPSSYDFTIDYSWDKNSISFPIWLEPGENLIITNNVRISIEIYK